MTTLPILRWQLRDGIRGLIACISWGFKAVAGTEDSGRLEMILTHVVGRGHYALESLLALTVRVVVLCVIAATAILILNDPSGLGLAPSHIVITTCVWGMLALTSGITALSVDAITRTTTNLSWLSYFPPYHWAYGDSPLQTGNPWGGIGLLVGLCGVLYALGYAAFTRRDVC